MEREWRADAHQCDHVPCSGREPEHTGSDRRTRRVVVNSAQATEKRECTPKCKVQSISDAKFPVNCSNR